MGIDRIGKGPVSPPKEGVGSASGSGSAERTGTSFEVSRPASPATPEHVRAVDGVRPAIERLRSGEIDLNAYLDSKVDEATAHLRALPPAQLDAVRSTLRERLASDPTLVELTRTATGQLPKAPDE
jgi:hypothetical protein